MGHNSAISGHLISTSFSQVDGWSTDPRVLGLHNSCFSSFYFTMFSYHKNMATMWTFTFSY